MKSLSVFKKFRLAFNSTGVLIRLFFILYGCFPLVMIFDKNDTDVEFLKILGFVSAGLIMAAINVTMSSLSLVHVGLYKVLPMNHKDIADVMILNTLITFGFLIIVHCAYLFIAGEISDMVWTLLCADFVAMALSVLIIPWYMVDKFAANANEANRESKVDEKTAKKNTIRVTLTSIFGMLVFAAIYCAILMLGDKNPQNFAMLGGFAAFGLAVLVTAVVISRRIKYPFNTK